jgi:hypothetical protein
MRGKIILAVMLVCIVGTTSVAWAQAVSTAQIKGTVTDQSGAVVPSAEVRITQTATGYKRLVMSGEMGGYVFTNLPIGHYEMQVSKGGFSKFTQRFELQVDVNPTINVVLAIGTVAQAVEVTESVVMVDTQNIGVGQVIDQDRIVELPLNGRQATQLIFLAGTSTPALAYDLNTNKNYPTVTISVSGGLPNGMTYLLDGGTHNDPFNNLNLPMPFPDALQEFKVETSALPARYGQHASAAVNAVTKTGTNQLHGSLFEFVRNYMFNARDYFATSRDSLKRNQFGGTVGGPVLSKKLFYFAGYQGTIEHSDPPTTTTIVPTAQMLAGDFTTFASTACQAQALTLKGPFVGNQVSPGLFNQAALNVLKFVPVATNPCGKLTYGITNNNRENQVLGRIDYNLSDTQTIYGRYFIGNYYNPVSWDGKDVLLANKTGVADQAQTFVLGDTLTLTSTMVSSLHASLIRTRADRVVVPYFSPQDVGVNVFSAIPGFMGISVTGGFTVGAAAINPGHFDSTGMQLAEDLDIVRSKHQIAVGAEWIHSIMNALNNRPSNGQFTFSGQTTGLGYADFLLGNLSSFIQGNPVYDYDRSNYIGMYAQDSWKVRNNLTLNYGARWEPFLPATNATNSVENFDINRFEAGIKSTVMPNAPAGLLFPGDPGYPGSSNTNRNLRLFAPRAGFVWDPKGDGKTSIRASYGLFFDSPQLFFFTRVANNPPWGAQVSLTNPAGGFSDPYAGQPGGNPFPGGSFFPLNGVYVTAPLHMKPMYLEQWNFGVQHEVGANTVVSAMYLGHDVVHMPLGTELNPAVYSPGATLANTNARRVLNLLDPTNGKYYSTIGAVDDGGTGSYNGLELSLQSRLAKHVNALANWTWSHCISDPETTEITGPTYTDPGNRGAGRSNCSADRRHVINVSSVVDTPRWNNVWLNRIAGNWQLSTIFRYQTGDFSTILTGQDNALTGINTAFNGLGLQRAVQLLANPYMPSPSAAQYLNPAAFGFPASGTLSSMRPFSVLNPNEVLLDAGLARYFPIREAQRLQFKWEVFNVPNHANMPAPQATLASPSTFGKIFGPSLTGPRLMQFALKYEF